MSELSKIMIRSGLLKEEQLNEFKRWGYPSQLVEGEPPKDLAHFVQEIEAALQEEDMVLVRETDLEALQIFLTNQLEGTLHLEAEVETADALPVRYGILRTGEYVIPWLDSAISELFVNVNSYLMTTEGVKIYFGAMRELFYGEVKAFAVCTPVIIEHRDAVITTPILPEGGDSGPHSADDNA